MKKIAIGKKSRFPIAFDTLKTSLPLLVSVSSYPLFAMISFFIIGKYYPFSLSAYILSQSVITIIIRCGESLLSGTRVITAKGGNSVFPNIQSILHSSIAISVWLSTLTLLGISLLRLAVPSLISNDGWGTLLLLSLGLYGHFLYNAVCYYTHGNKETKYIPLASWVANVGGILLMYGVAHYSHASYINCIFCYSFSRLLMGPLLYWLIPSGLKGPLSFFSFFQRDKMQHILKIGVSYLGSSFLITASYFLFTLHIEQSCPNELSGFQALMHLLNVCSAINVPIASSGAIILIQHLKEDLLGRQNVFKTILCLNILIFIILFTFFFLTKSFLLTMLGQTYFQIKTFNFLFILSSLIYLVDLMQIIAVQTLTYHDDYLAPPAIRTIIFASVAFSLLLAFFFRDGALGVLTSIFLATLTSFGWVLLRFKKHLPDLYQVISWKHYRRYHERIY